jgi:hypothetical protein
MSVARTQPITDADRVPRGLIGASGEYFVAAELSRPEHFYYRGHRDYFRRVSLLPFGGGVIYGDETLSCFSRRSGLTCENVAGHGFWLGRYHGYRIW